MADKQNLLSTEDRALVSSNGEVTIMAQAYLISTCAIDMTYFPFDIQKCHLRFVSWLHDTNSIILLPSMNDGESMTSN